jgi:autotransporter-associated beta strand protein
VNHHTDQFLCQQFGIIAAKQTKRLLLQWAMLLTMMLGFELQGFSAANTWQGPAGGDWNTVTNWSLHVPIPSDAVVIPENSSVVISGTAECNNLTINSGATVTNNGTLSIGNLLSGPGELINGAFAVLNIGGDATITTLTATADGNTVNYNRAGAQSVNGTTYYNLTISGSGTKTLGGNADVGGVLTVKAGTTLDLGANSLGAAIPPTSVVLECGASTGSVISGNGILYLGYNYYYNVTVNSVSSGTGGANISCPLVMDETTGSIAFDVANDGTSETDLSVSGVISTNHQVSKAGEGTLMLSGLNTHTNLTNIHAGTLKLGSAGNGTNSPLGTAAEGTWVVGGVLDLNGYTLSTNEALYLIGTGISNGGALINSSTNPVSYSGYINLASASSIGTTGNITKVTLQFGIILQHPSY